MSRRLSAADIHRRNSGEHAEPSRPEIRRLLPAAMLLSAGFPAILALLGAPAARASGGDPGGSPSDLVRAKDPEASSSAASSEAPILEGVLDAVQIIGISSEWRENLVAYAPDTEVVERIRAISSKIRPELKVEVIIGTWCGDSRREVPHFIKVQQKLSDDRLPVVFMGVDRSKQNPAAVAAGRDIQRVPTFIVYHNEREIGRIVEKPKVSIEADLEEILASLP